MRAELRASVTGFFAGLQLPDTPPVLTETDSERLVALAQLVTRSRSPVERDSYISREIELVPEAEAPDRLVVVLAGILEGLRSIGLDPAEAWRLVVKLGLDSIPAQRRAVLELLLVLESDTTTRVATALSLPTSTAKRALEDLAAHSVLERESGGKGKADTWRASRWAIVDHAAVTSPETSAEAILGQPEMSDKQTYTTTNDFSGLPEALENRGSP